MTLTLETFSDILSNWLSLGWAVIFIWVVWTGRQPRSGLMRGVYLATMAMCFLASIILASQLIGWAAAWVAQ